MTTRQWHDFAVRRPRPPGRSSDSAARSSGSSWITSRPTFRPTSRSTSSWTTLDPQDEDWFARRPRWHVHFTPTSASWLNQVERFFADLTEKQIRRGVHRSTAELELTDYIETVNAIIPDEFGKRGRNNRGDQDKD